MMLPAVVVLFVVAGVVFWRVQAGSEDDGSSSGSSSGSSGGGYQSSAPEPDPTPQQTAATLDQMLAQLDPACRPLASQWLAVVERLNERESGEKTKGLLGLSAAYDRARANTLGARVSSCLAGMDLTGFGAKDATALLGNLLNAYSASRGGSNVITNPDKPGINNSVK